MSSASSNDKPKRSTKFGVGNPGKPKGAVNKTTKAVKEMIKEALDGVGGSEYLMEQARTNPGAFLALIGKIIPAEIKSEITGANGGPIVVASPKDEDL